MDPDDIGMVQGLERHQFPIGAVFLGADLLRRDLLSLLGGDLERIGPPIPLDAVEDTEAAGADPGDDPVEADPGARKQIAWIDQVGHANPAAVSCPAESARASTRAP